MEQLMKQADATAAKIEQTQGTWYVLLDASQYEKLPSTLKASAEVTYLFEDMEEFAELDGAGPWLLECGQWDTAKSAVQHWLETNCMACSWMYSSMSLKRLTRHLHDQLRVQLPNGGIRILRFFDPRVFRTIATTFDAEQLNRLLAGISIWLFATEGQVESVSGGEQQNIEEAPYVINIEQQQQIARATLPFTVLEELRQIQAEMLSLYTPAEQVKGLRDMVTEAQSLGLQQLNDIVAFCTLGFYFDLNFYKHPEVALQLASLKDKRQLPDVIGDVPDTIWDELSQRNDHRKEKLKL